MVKEAGVKKLKTTDPKYELPSCKFFAEKALPVLYIVVQERFPKSPISQQQQTSGLIEHLPQSHGAFDRGLRVKKSLSPNTLLSRRLYRQVYSTTLARRILKI